MGAMASPSVPGIRERNRAAIEREILRVGRLHLAQVGAAALSLRAVARDLGMASSAVYRYVANRDDLLTLLIVSAYDDLGDHVDAALAGAGGGARARFTVLCGAVRAWARAHPHDYALLFGSPVPHYAAPAERTTTPGTRVQAHLVAILAEADPDASDEHLSGDPALVSRAAADLEPLLRDPLFVGVPLSPALVLRGLAAWALVLGALSAELFEQLGPDTITDPDLHFSAMVVLAADLVLP